MLCIAIALNIGLSVLTGILAFGTYLWLIARKCQNIPGNLGFPIIGNFFQVVKNYWHTSFPDFIKYVDRNADKFGDLACFWHCHKLSIGVSDPVLVEKLHDHPNLYNKSHFVYKRTGYFLKNTFWLSETDDEWRLRRKELVSHMRKNDLDAFRSVFIKTSKKAVEVWSVKPKMFNIKPYTTLLFLEATCRTHFGIDVDVIDNIPLYEEIYLTSSINATNMINPIIGNVAILVEKLLYPRTQKEFEEMILDKVKQMGKQLMNVDRDQKSNMAATIALRNLLRENSDVDISRELKELLYVSSHTSALTSTAALMFLATHPEIQEKVWQEQEDIFGDSDRDPTYDDIKKMEYLDRFFKETLRFTSPPIIARGASGEVDLGGKIIPEGATVITNFLRMKFSPRYWENPKKFDPNRFLEENIAKVHKSAYAFFGVGIRNCPGMAYANYFIKIFLSTIVRNLKLHTKCKFEDIKFRENIVMDIVGECHISVEKRVKNTSVN